MSDGVTFQKLTGIDVEFPGLLPNDSILLVTKFRARKANFYFGTDSASSINVNDIQFYYNNNKYKIVKVTWC